MRKKREETSQRGLGGQRRERGEKKGKRGPWLVGPRPPLQGGGGGGEAWEREGPVLLTALGLVFTLEAPAPTAFSSGLRSRRQMERGV